jgi:hypothetical protein
MRAHAGKLLMVAALAGGAACAGGGGQNSPALLPGNAQNMQNAFGNAPSGSTVLRIKLPLNGALAQSTAAPSLGPGAQQQSPLATALPVTINQPNPTVQNGSQQSGATAGGAQTLAVSFSGPTSLSQTLPLTVGSPNCISATASTVCQMTAALAPGTYTATVTLYASSMPAPATAVTSPQTIAFAVSYGGSNVVNVSYGGTPAAVQLVPASSNAAVNAQGGIDLFGAGKHVLLAQLVDVNQNVLLEPSQASYSVVQTSGAAAMSALPQNGTANGFVVSPAVPYAGMASLRATASFAGAVNPCAAPGASCNGSTAIDVRQMLAVANSSANTVTLYAGGSTSLLATVSSGITNPQALVFDAAGDLFVAGLPASVTEYAPPYGGSAATIGSGVNHPQALALDSRGNLFVANGNGSNSVTMYSPPYTGSPTAIVTNGINDPVSLALDSSNDLFVVNQGAGTVTEYAPPYLVPIVTLSNGLNGPNSVALDARGNLFVSNVNATPNSVVEFTPPFSASSQPAVTITSGVNEQGSIAVTPGSTVFVPNQGANTVTAYGPPYSTMPTTITGGQNQPVALAIDAQANLYVANYGNGTVTQYAPPYAGMSWLTISNGISGPQALSLSPSTSAFAIP